MYFSLISAGGAHPGQARQDRRDGAADIEGAHRLSERHLGPQGHHLQRQW